LFISKCLSLVSLDYRPMNSPDEPVPSKRAPKPKPSR
jgi:hypothetical protein